MAIILFSTQLLPQLVPKLLEGRPYINYSLGPRLMSLWSYYPREERFKF